MQNETKNPNQDSGKQNLTLAYKILHFPLTKIIIGFLVIGLVAASSLYLIEELLYLISFKGAYYNLVTTILVSFSVLITYNFLYRFYEKRKVTELALKPLLGSLSSGIIIGGLLQSLTIYVMYLYGYFSIISYNSVLVVIPALTMAISSGVVEEVIFRGVLFRIIEEKLGSYLSLVISGLIFGFMHYSNPNSSIGDALSIAIQAGLLLGAAYIYTRNLWLPIGIHFAWNFFQSGVFGASTSGHDIGSSLITAKIEGAIVITGGAFGPEGTIQATIFCLIVTFILMFLSHKKGNVIKPYWKK